MRERVFITGGSGFVGANLARAEVEAGNEVHLLLRPESRKWRLAGLEGRYELHPGDLRDAESLRRAVGAAKPDVIYHLAVHGAYPSQRDRKEILTTNLIGTINLLESLAGREFRALVNAGSSSEYGRKDRPMCEADVLEPRTDYGVTKAAATLLCQAEAFKGMPVCTVRIFSAFGPWEEPSRLVPYVLDCCMRSVPAQVKAGSQPRDFMYVDDVVDLIRTAAYRPECRGRILHAGRGVQSSTREMVETIHEVCGGPRPQYADDPPRPDDPLHWVADTTLTRTLTGWTPRYTIRDGIQRMKEWWCGEQRREAS